MFGYEEMLLLALTAPGGTVVQIFCQPQQSGLSTKKKSCSQASCWNCHRISVENLFPEFHFLSYCKCDYSIWLSLLASVLRFVLSLASQSVVKSGREKDLLFYSFTSVMSLLDSHFGWPYLWFSTEQNEVRRMCWDLWKPFVGSKSLGH